MIYRSKAVSCTHDTYLKVTFHEYYFLLLATLRDLQFHRIYIVTEALKYMHTSTAPVPRISDKLTSCKI